jgi:hypothetical protein
LNCQTFKKDALGNNLRPSEAAKNTPRRTRVFVVVTHRDSNVGIQRSNYQPLIEEMRGKFPWVGAVAFIDQRVSLAWLFDTIVVCAGYQAESNVSHHIPLIEMFENFPMTFPPLKNRWHDYVEEAKSALSRGADLAKARVQEAAAAREKAGVAGGNSVDNVGPTIDCVIGFLDDLYETETMKALAKCYTTQVEELWIDTSPDINNVRVQSMNTIKQLLAPSLSHVRRKIVDSFPRCGEAVMFKKCPHMITGADGQLQPCGAVYQRPTGCDHLGYCGKKAGVAQDATHNGVMDMAYVYEYRY